MAEIYDHDYLPLSMYGNVVALLREAASGDGLHVDIGCGYGAIAEPVRDELKRCYIGFDLAEDGLASLRRRGFESYKIDLAQLTNTETIVREAVRGREISSFTLLDTLEHITNGSAVLAMLYRLARQYSAPLILSVPNVSHKDIAIKLLMGRWDVTEAGLLDHTHVSFYNHNLLSRTMRSVGWSEIGSQDWLLEHSDQHFPPDAAAFNRHLPLAQFLRELAGSANPHALVNQFVRAYRPDEPESLNVLMDRDCPTRSFLSVVMIADVARPDRLRRAVRFLERQTNNDFEFIVLLLGSDKIADTERKDHIRASRNWLGRLTVLPVEGSVERAEALNKIITRVGGSYFTIIDEEDLIEPQWVETFINLSAAAQGAVLRIQCDNSDDTDFRTRDRGDVVNSEMLQIRTVNLLTEPPQRRASISNVAIPVTVFSDLGVRFVGSSPAEANQELVSRASIYCGAISCQIPADRYPLAHDEDALGPCSTPHDPLGFNQGPILLPFSAAQEARRLAKRSAGERHWLNTKLEEALSEVRKLGLHHEEQRSELTNLRAWRRVIEGQPVLGALIRQCIPAAPLCEIEYAQASGPERPFLSVIARTQGRRVDPMRDMLMSLAGQSCQDFILFVVLHRCDEVRSRAVHNLISEFPNSFRERIIVLRCEQPGRSAPLNEALKHVQSRYVSVLDDDDFVFGHWVETFRSLSMDAPEGSLLRAVSVRQSFDIVPTSEDSTLTWAKTWFSRVWPSSYDTIDHLHDNHTPFMSVAYPAQVFRDLGLRFDEGLSTAEDWELTTRAAMLCGVVSSPDVTSVYRWWTNGESSLFEHPPEEWRNNSDRILRNLDSCPILLPPGTASRISDMGREREQMREYVKKLEAQCARLSERTLALSGQLLNAGIHLADPEASPVLDEFAHKRLLALITSTSWRITRPVRRLMGLFRRHPGAELAPESLPPGFDARQQAILAILSSTSWRLTRPLRAVAGLRGGLG